MTRLAIGVLALLVLLVDCCTVALETSTYGPYEYEAASYGPYEYETASSDYNNNYEYGMTLGDLRRGLHGAVNNMVSEKMHGDKICPQGTTFCVKSMRCVPARCKDNTESPTDLSDLRKGLEIVINKAIYEKISPNAPCPHGTTFCVKSMRCVPARCKDNTESPIDLSDLRRGLENVLNKAIYEKIGPNIPCPHGTTLCLGANKCVKSNSRCGKDDEDRSLSVKRLRDELAQTVNSLIHRQTSKQQLCPENTMFCLKRNQCVRHQCRKEENYNYYDNGPSIDDLRVGLRGEVNTYLHHLTDDETSFCPKGTVFCMSTHTCVAARCSRIEDKFGDCPATNDMSICAASVRCFSDSEGCEGNDKCCPTACGGSICTVPEFNLAGGSIDSDPYRVITYTAAEEPTPVKIASDLGFFAKTDTGKSFRFNITGASPGCVWKKVTSEVQQLPDDKTVRTWAAITDTEDVPADTSISCMPIEMSFHGIAKVMVTDEESVTHIFAAIITPANLPPLISRNTDYNSSKLYLEEDYPMNITLPVNISSHMSLHPMTFSDDDMIGLSTSAKGLEYYTNYKKRIDTLREKVTGSLGVYIKLMNVTGRFGTLSLFNSDTAAGQGWTPISVRNGGYGAPSINFEPAPDYFGEFRIVIFAWSGTTPPNPKKDISVENVTFTVTIVNVNDAPRMPESVFDLLTHNVRGTWTVLPVPLDLADNEGMLVADAVSDFFFDPEGDPLGMCVIRAQSSDLGEYQYLPAGADAWISIDVEDPSSSYVGEVMPPFNSETIAEMYALDDFDEVLHQARNGGLPVVGQTFSHECQLVRSDSRIRFQPTNADTFWPYNSDNKWDIMAWDENVGGVEGEKMLITLPFCENCTSATSLLSYTFVSGDAMRLGCNGKISPVTMVVDICGECGGDGTRCLDCNGDNGGDAIRNQCGECVLGNTGISDEDHGRDCKGGCSVGLFEVIDELDGACLPVGTDVDALITNVYCDGEWRSGAKIDDCGICTGGTTNLGFNDAMDACGICNGNGESCIDCDGKVNGGFLMDVCNQCRDPASAEFNTGCQDLGSFYPEYVLPNVDGYLDIMGAGLSTLFPDNVGDISCTLTADGNIVSLTTVEMNSRPNLDTITTTYDAIPATGEYAIECTFGTGDSAPKLSADSMLKVLLPQPASLSPSEIVIGNIPSMVVITGTGFVDTGDAHCFTNCPTKVTRDCRGEDSVALFEAVVVDSTTVNCLIPINVRQKLNVGLSLEISFAISDPRYATDSERALYNKLGLVFSAPAPQIDSASFIGACKVNIIFDMNVNEVATCAEALDTASVAKLGTDPECFVRSSILVIILGPDATLTAGDTLTLESEAISQRNTDSNMYASGSVPVEATDIESVRFESIEAPPMIGNCDALTIRAKFQGAGCSNLEYTWEVEVVDDGGDASAASTDRDSIASDLDTVNDGLVDITADYIIPGATYRFNVFVETHLGERSPVQSVEVTRNVDPQPLMVALGSDIVDWDNSRDLTFRARASKSDCADIDITGVQFIWNAETTDFDLSDFTSVNAKVLGGVMKGGKSYTITVLAIVTNNPSVTASASVIVTTASKPLVPVIKRAPVMFVGVDNSFELDVSKSRDPDRADADAVYFVWTCEKIVLDDDLVATKLPCEVTQTASAESTEIVQFENSRITEDETAEVITIPASTLDSGSVYLLTVLMAKNERTASTTITINVQQGSPPEITIEPKEGKHKYGKDLYIQAAVTSSLAFDASWSSASEEGYEQLDYSDFGADNEYSATSNKRDFPVNLVIDGDKLKAGASYKFVLFVEHKDSSAEAEVVVTVNAPPTCSAFDVAPVDGTALTDLFTAEVGGCEDDADDFPLQYQFFLISGDSERALTHLQSESSKSSVLESGVFSVKVKVCDQQKSCMNITAGSSVNVSEIIITDDSVSDLLTQIAEQRNLEGSSDMAAAVVKEILSDESAPDSVKQAGLDIAKDEAKNSLSKANPQADPEGSYDSLTTATDTLLSTKGVTIGGVAPQTVDKGTSDQFMDKSSETVVALVGSSDASGAKRRKKRAAGEESTINSIDIETGEGMMLVQVTALEETAEEDIEKDSADAFFNTLELVWQGVCAGLLPGQSAQVGKTSLLTFRAHSIAFDSLGNATLPISCEDCAEVDTPANLSLGSHLLNNYGVWNCTGDESCYGGCLATGQLNYDILTASSDSIEPNLSDRLSDIVAIHLINPSTFAYASISNIPSPLTFTIQLTSAPQFQTYEYMCRGWDTVLNDWSDSMCLPAILDNTTSSWIAACNCYSTGYFGVFKGAEIIDQTLFATTEASNATNTTTTQTATTTTDNPAMTIMLATNVPVNLTSDQSSNASNATTSNTSGNRVVIPPTTTAADYLDGVDEEDVESISVRFRIDADAALLESNYSGVQISVLSWLSISMNVTESRITNLVLSAGSIRVEFDLLPGSGAQTDMNSAIANLESEVLAGASVTILGVSYSCIIEPLYTSTNLKSTASSTEEIVEAEKGIRLGVIIGVVVGCCLLVILMVVIIAVVIIKKNNSSNKVRNSPRGSEAQIPPVDDYELKKTTVSPEEEALYGPAPVPHRPSSVTSKMAGHTVPIGSRPNSTKGENSMTPVGSE